MPAVSKKQQQAMAIAMHAPKSKLKGASKKIANNMSKDKIRHYAETPTKNLPTKVEEGEIPQAPDDLQKLIDQYDRHEIEMGMDIEQEHNGGHTLDVSNSPLDTLRIVLAHMKEDPEYYTHLKSMEKRYKVDEMKLTKMIDFKKLPIGATFRMGAEQRFNGKPSEIFKKVSNTKYRDLKSKQDVNLNGRLGPMGTFMVLPEGTTSSDSFRYDKSPTNTYKAPEMKPDHFAQEDMEDMELDKEIDHPDPQYASTARARTEGDIENKKLKGRNLLWDDEEEDDDREIDEDRLGEEIVRMVRAMRGIK